MRSFVEMYTFIRVKSYVASSERKVIEHCATMAMGSVLLENFFHETLNG